MRFSGPWRFDYHGINDNQGSRICKVQKDIQNDSVRKELQEKFELFSRLISKAPEMYSLLERAMNLLRLHSDTYSRDVSTEISGILSYVDTGRGNTETVDSSIMELDIVGRSLQEASEYSLSAEVVYSMLLFARNNPNASIGEICTHGTLEWIK